MQKFLFQLRVEDRRIARKWSIATLGFYGSILAGMVLYAALNTTPSQSTSAGGKSDVQMASTNR